MAQAMAVESQEAILESKLEKSFAVKQIGELKYEGTVPLGKPSPKSRGVYGGNLCGQALVVALETVEAGFTPHSLHSYFVKAGSDKSPCQYEVEKVSDGRNFANRLIRVVQNGSTCYIVMISLTKKNSIDKTIKEFNEDPSKTFPFEFHKPVPDSFFKYDLKDLHYFKSPHNPIAHKFLPEYLDKTLTPEELDSHASERELSMWIKIDDKITDPKYKYAAFGVMSDSQFLTSLPRILHLTPSKSEPVSGGQSSHFFSVSLDHSIYFHDDCLDPTEWNFFNYSAPRFSNNRVLFQGSYYNSKGKLVATMIQEGLIFFRDGHERRAKL